MQDSMINRRRRSRAALGVLAAGSVLVATAGSAAAANATSPSTTTPPTSGGTQRPARPFSVTGTLKSVGKNSLAFELADDSVATATLSKSTVFVKTETKKPASLSNGKRVTVVGTTTKGVLAATRITVTPAGGTTGFGGFGGGRRFAAGGGSAGRTNGSPPSFPAGSRPSLPAGANGRRFGPGGQGAGGFGNFTFGTISGFSHGDFTLTEANKTKVKVTTTAKTVVSETVRTTKKGLKVGQQLFIVGREVNNTTVAATTVSQGNSGFGAFGRGRPGPGAPTSGS